MNRKMRTLYPTEKQRRQRNLYLALGTVMGFRGYLRNLQTVIKRCGLHPQDINIFRCGFDDLTMLEKYLRRKLTELKNEQS